VLRRVIGDDVDPAIRPLLAVQAAGSLAGSMAFTYIALWGLERLHASSGALGFAFLAAAVASAATGYLGGHLSDRIGRRPLILFGRGAFALSGFAAALATDNELAGITVIVLTGALTSLGDAADSALVADLVEPDGRERAYAALRVAANMGVILGPPTGGLLLTRSWTWLFCGSATLSVAAFVLAWRTIPARGAFTPDEPPARGSFAVIRTDRAFLLLLAGMALSWMVYQSWEILMPVSLVREHGYPRWAWGFIVVLNPIVVALAQLRLNRAVEHRPRLGRIVLALFLMGPPFLGLAVSDAVPVVIMIVVLFVIGEMLWVPAAMGAIADLAPADIRGAYMGAAGATGSVGFALTPLLGLQVLARAGDTAMWASVAGIAILSAGLFTLALRRGGGTAAVSP
jgi:MFS family permease